jgi:hypothetical protein
MKSKTMILAISILIVVVLAWIATRQQSKMLAGLPPRLEYPTLGSAALAAQEYANEHGGAIVAVAGTGSMAPYVPPGHSKTLAEQKTEIVAYVVTDPKATYASIRPGMLVIYRPDWLDGHPCMHQAAQRDGAGWVMSGLHNQRSESEERMTPEKFTGVVAHAFVIQQ